MSAKERILIINVTRIGDTLLATPAIKAIALAYPNSRIDVLAHPKRSVILEEISFIDKLGSITKNTASYRGWHAFLFGKTYELAFIYGHDISLMSYALRVSRKVIAFRQEKEKINNRLYKIVENPSSFKEDHAVKMLLRLPASMNIGSCGLRLSYVVGKEEASRAKKKLIDEIIEFKNVCPLIGIQTTSFPTKSYRDWPIEYFINLTKKIIDLKSNCHFVLFGGPDPAEKERVSMLSQSLGQRSTDLSGMSLRDTGAIMGELDLYIGVDTGPTHIMGAFDIPIVVLYHSFLPSEFVGPLDHPSAFPVDQEKSSHDSPFDLKMSDISVDTVFTRVVQALRVSTNPDVVPHAKKTGNR